MQFAVCTGAIPDVKMSLFGVGVDLVVLVALVSVDVVEIFFCVLLLLILSEQLLSVHVQPDATVLSVSMSGFPPFISCAESNA